MEGVVNRTSWKASVEGLLNRSLGCACGGALTKHSPQRRRRNDLLGYGMVFT